MRQSLLCRVSLGAMFPGFLWVLFMLMAWLRFQMPNVQQRTLPRLWSTKCTSPPMTWDFSVSIYLSYIVLIRRLLSCLVAPTLKSPAFNSFLVPGPSVDTTPEHGLKGEELWQNLSFALCAFCAFLHTLPELKANHMIAHVPHRQEFTFYRNVLVASEKWGLVNIFHNAVCCSMYLEVLTSERISEE